MSPLPKPPSDAATDAAIEAALAAKTMPPGALGRIGDLACRLARMQGTLAPVIEAPALAVFCADHGIARQGVSAYPQDVTWQMVLNLLAGGAAAAVFARSAGLSLTVVDVGVAHDFDASARAHPAFVDAKAARGTADCTQGAAMTRAQCEAAMAAGARVAAASAGNVLALGEVGIGNTSAAALLTAHFTGASLAACVGRGTGLDDAGLARKQAVLERAFALHAPARRSGEPLDALAALGGLEIAAMAGAALEAARLGRVVVVDGFVATAALLAARAIDPAVLDACVLSHRSAEHGHAVAIESLCDGGRLPPPLLALDMRLGEGTGAALAVPLLRCAADMLREMATFASAGVAQASS